ncbi:hypothetical protein [Curtobacterium sp. MCBD17_021]|uniref:hypothetical protein n=1 Tax=Curtobacterium sp. MCBD17_021 TaxID=2175665 RepID=UPI0011B63048|nr:hypothetical protein [Curtobacterium sp. MCBD17_021]
MIPVAAGPTGDRAAASTGSVAASGVRTDRVRARLARAALPALVEQGSTSLGETGRVRDAASSTVMVAGLLARRVAPGAVCRWGWPRWRSEYRDGEHGCADGATTSRSDHVQRDWAVTLDCSTIRRDAFPGTERCPAVPVRHRRENHG